MKKIYLVLFILVLVFVGIILYYRYLSLTKYNVYPAKAIEEYLQETYHGNFTLLEFEFKRGPQKSYIWEYKYMDYENLEFYIYFTELYEDKNGMTLFFDPTNMRARIIDRYWMTKLTKVYEEVIKDGKIQVVDDRKIQNAEGIGLFFYFIIQTEEEIMSTSELIAEMLKYSFDNVKEPSENSIRFVVEYQEEIIYYFSRNSDIPELKNAEEKELFDFIFKRINDKWNYYKEQKERFGF